MAKRTRYHITPRDDGWSVSKEGASRSSGNYGKKDEAIEKGRDLARSSQGELLIHGKDGKIQEERTYGRDPYPPSG